MKYYLDTSILLDYYENRGSNGRQALALILKILKDNSLLIFSDLHIKELKNLHYSSVEINSVINIFKPNVVRAHINKNQIAEARRMKEQINIPLSDILHSIISRDNESILVYRDHHFEKLKYLITIKKPEELL